MSCRSPVAGLVTLALVAACSSGGGGAGPTTATSPPSTTSTTTTTSVPSTNPATTTVPPSAPVRAAFASYRDVALLGDVPAYAGLVTPTSLKGVRIADEVAEQLQATVDGAQLLAENGFVVVPGSARRFSYPYEQGGYAKYPVFVTTDVAFNTWHLVFDKVLRDVEQLRLLPQLEDMVTRLVASSRTQATALAGGPLADQALRVQELFEAAATLLEIDVGSVGPRATAEVALVTEAAQLTTSPVTSFEACDRLTGTGCVDYSLFRPRGHYTGNPQLERYFRAMSLLGQEPFFLAQPASLQLALLAAPLITTDPEILAAWRSVYEPTAFLVGLADDYSPIELVAAAEAVRPGSTGDPGAIADAAYVTAVKERLARVRPVLINPDNASVRVMGARFVLDAYVLDQLGWPNVGTLPDARVFVSPLDVASVFGSELATSVQAQAGEPEFTGYGAQLSRLTGQVARRTGDEWAGTVYDSWLHAIAAVWTPKSQAFPGFMRTGAWAAKSLQTGLGSYTELKHDTILYAKQAFLGESGDDVPDLALRHWVEPDPVAFGRLSAAAALLQDGLAARELLTPTADELLTGIRVDFLDRLGALARDELAGKPISEDDNAWLESIGGWLEMMWVRSSDPVGGEEGSTPVPGEEWAALVADIARARDLVLELGTGAVDRILVLVPDDDGVFQVAVGGTYSYYELWQDATSRLTDEEWRQQVEAGDVPDREEPLVLPDGRSRPAWQAPILATGS